MKLLNFREIKRRKYAYKTLKVGNDNKARSVSSNLGRMDHTCFIWVLNKIKEEYPEIIKEVRGIGLLIGLQLYNDQTKFIKKLEDNKLLTMRAGENVVRILPPLNVK